MMDLERQDSRKRRRLSERRRVFSRIGLNNSRQPTSGAGGGSLSSDQSWSSSSQQQHHANQTLSDLTRQQSNSSRSDSPLSEGNPSILTPTTAAVTTPMHPTSRKKSTDSIGDQIHERLSRQNTMSTRRRQQLLAMHNKMALNSDGPRGRANSARCERDGPEADSNDSTTMRKEAPLEPRGGRDASARASTITGGISDEATVNFLARHDSTRHQHLDEIQRQAMKILAQPVAPVRPEVREHIFFKRDGQRFGHEFTLKLAVDRTYRCLLKIRPLIPLQAISIQGHHVLFADCSQSSSGAAAAASTATANTVAPSSAPASSSVLNRSWQDIRNQGNNHHHNQKQNQQSHNHRLNHAQTTSNLSRASLTPFNRIGYLYQQQQNQMMRYFSASHCSSSSNPHLGSQLIYMFDWSASRFEVNKNKARTQIQTVLKFKNGQILSLPLQVKFYQSECRQHLSWGSQLHFIDYDCNINNMGHINVDRVQYY